MPWNGYSSMERCPSNSFRPPPHPTIAHPAVDNSPHLRNIPSSSRQNGECSQWGRWGTPSPPRTAIDLPVYDTVFNGFSEREPSPYRPTLPPVRSTRQSVGQLEERSGASFWVPPPVHNGPISRKTGGKKSKTKTTWGHWRESDSLYDVKFPTEDHSAPPGLRIMVACSKKNLYCELTLDDDKQVEAGRECYDRHAAYHLTFLEPIRLDSRVHYNGNVFGFPLPDNLSFWSVQNGKATQDFIKQGSGWAYWTGRPATADTSRTLTIDYCLPPIPTPSAMSVSVAVAPASPPGSSTQGLYGPNETDHESDDFVHSSDATTLPCTSNSPTPNLSQTSVLETRDRDIYKAFTSVSSPSKKENLQSAEIESINEVFSLSVIDEMHAGNHIPEPESQDFAISSLDDISTIQSLDEICAGNHIPDPESQDIVELADAISTNAVTESVVICISDDIIPPEDPGFVQDDPMEVSDERHAGMDSPPIIAHTDTVSSIPVAVVSEEPGTHTVNETDIAMVIEPTSLNPQLASNDGNSAHSQQIEIDSLAVVKTIHQWFSEFGKLSSSGPSRSNAIPAFGGQGPCPRRGGIRETLVLKFGRKFWDIINALTLEEYSQCSTQEITFMLRKMMERDEKRHAQG
ncbi:hypothetical protein FA15DRAFT_661377 [Coprinopsis marcescibilis]|uniref:Uncharacterized protein n=1 Tax=Coprinopsis marcescibilis TaxID=230819 RepID=A0A5C3KCF7_COPMA|nr:hypothetical protein FA15DRAFT_661377 [Coprinopsis marcescibilis]